MATTAVSRARVLDPRRFLGLSAASCGALFLVVTSGAFVRLTGSGLGCENWPRCGDKPYPEQGYHAFVEFGNRMVALVGILLTLATWLAARKVDGLSRIGRGAALAAFLVAVAQIPMGGITIAVDLHPLAVMTHFLLGLACLGLTAIVVLEAWSLVSGLAAPAGPRWLRQRRHVARRSRVRRARRHRRRRDRVGTASWRERGGGATRLRDRRHRVRPRARGGGIRDRRPRRRLVPLATPRSLPGICCGSGGSCSSCSSRRRSSARCSTGTRFRGASCSSTSSSPRRSGSSASPSRSCSGGRLRRWRASKLRRMEGELRMYERPTLERPVLIGAFRGWNDGGQAATLATGYLARLWDAQKFADIDPELFVDFQATRPQVSLEEGRRAGSSGRRTRSSARGSPGPTATRCCSSASSRTTAGGPSPTSSPTSRATSVSSWS